MENQSQPNQDNQIQPYKDNQSPIPEMSIEVRYIPSLKNPLVMAITINDGADAAKINEMIAALNYNGYEVLAFDGTRITSFIPRTGELTPTKFIVILKTKHTVDGSFDTSVPTAFQSIAHLGALLKGNQKLVEGMPEPVVVKLAPRKVTINLPGGWTRCPVSTPSLRIPSSRRTSSTTRARWLCSLTWMCPI